MKKNLFVLCLLLCATTLVRAQFSGKGSGMANDPYQVTDAYELSEVRNDLAASYMLMNDIDLTEWINDNNPTSGWAPIGTYTAPFTGTFDGNNKCIYGLKINRTSLDYIGLFGYSKKGGKISNTVLVKPTIKGKGYVGGFSGCQAAVITNCLVIGGSIEGNSNYVGGIAGYSENNIMECYCNTTVKGVAYVGGIAGLLYYYATVTNNIFSGNVSATDTHVGGISGYFNSSSSSMITYNYVMGSIEGKEYVGGIVSVTNSNYRKTSNNVCIADEVSATSSVPYRISLNAGTNNLAWSQTKLIQNGKEIVAEDNDNNGTSYGEKTLKRSTTYIGIGWDFNNTWTIVEGESYPYLKAQTDYPVVTSCEAGSKCIVKGTAPTGGKITVIAGESIYSSAILDNSWEVSLGAMSEGQTISVFSLAEGKLPSLVVTAVITKGNGTSPDVVRGDVNGDGFVDTADVVATVNHILGKSSASFVKANADMNGDGTILIDDAVAIAQLILDKQ